MIYQSGIQELGQNAARRLQALSLRKGFAAKSFDGEITLQEKWE